MCSQGSLTTSSCSNCSHGVHSPSLYVCIYMTHPVVGTCHCRMEIQEEGGKQHVVYIAPHHKTERKTFGVIKIVIPDGDLAELAMLHITKGHAVMCIKVEHPQPNLFMTSKGLSLMGSKAAFNYCWDGILKGKWCQGCQHGRMCSHPAPAAPCMWSMSLLSQATNQTNGMGRQCAWVVRPSNGACTMPLA